MIGYHFEGYQVANKLIPRETFLISLPIVGETRSTNGKIKNWGDHISSSPRDALFYEHGWYCAKVQLIGNIIEKEYATCEGRESITNYFSPARKYLTNYVDMTQVLQVWALDCAERVAHKSLSKNNFLRKIIEAGRAYLREEITYEDMVKIERVQKQHMERYAKNNDAEVAVFYAYATLNPSLSFCKDGFKYFNVSRPAFYCAESAVYAADDIGKEVYWQHCRLTELLETEFAKTSGLSTDHIIIGGQFGGASNWIQTNLG